MRDAVFDTLVRILVEIKRDPSLTAIEPTANLEKIGLNSLELTDFVLRVEDQLDIVVDFDRLDQSDLQTLGAFRAFLNGISA
jgi:acyl carrier protein